MKKLILISLIILLLPISLFSKNKNLNLGILAGVNFSHLNGGYVEQIRGHDQLTNKFGLNGGIYLSYNINSASSVNVELIYVEKGSLWLRPFYIPYIYDPAWDGDYVDYRINYVELPIQYEYHMIKRNNGSKLLNLLIGLFFSFVHSASDQWIFELAPNKDIPSDPLDNNINHFDFGLTFGLKFFLDKAERFFVKMNFDYSLVNIHKNGIKRAPADFPDKKNLKMRSLLLYLGVNF